MKLYATVTSERATKSQGGEYLNIQVLNESREEILAVNVRNGVVHIMYPDYTGGYTYTLNTHKLETKGEKKKVECPKCKSPIWDIAYGHKLNKCHKCGTAFN